MRNLLCVAALVAAVCVTIPRAGWAAPPVLQGVSFDETSDTLSVTWSLPNGVQSRVLEASQESGVDSEGYFLLGSHHGYHGDDIVSELPDPNATSWLHQYPNLVPGHYYVHVGGLDTTCSACPIEWTALGTFDVNQPPPPPPPPPVKCVVPKVVGTPLAKAKRKLLARHCRTGRVTYGHSRLRRGLVYWQSRRAGARLPRATRVGLRVSR